MSAEFMKVTTRTKCDQDGSEVCTSGDSARIRLFKVLTPARDTYPSAADAYRFGKVGSHKHRPATVALRL
jgi:hypothetical protein